MMPRTAPQYAARNTGAYSEPICPRASSTFVSLHSSTSTPHLSGITKSGWQNPVFPSALNSYHCPCRTASVPNVRASALPSFLSYDKPRPRLPRTLLGTGIHEGRGHSLAHSTVFTTRCVILVPTQFRKLSRELARHALSERWSWCALEFISHAAPRPELLLPSRLATLHFVFALANRSQTSPAAIGPATSVQRAGARNIEHRPQLRLAMPFP